MSKITLQRLKKIIQEELNVALNEGEEYDSASKVMSSAVKLLNALEDFRESATAAATSATSPHAESLEQALKQIVGSPLQYVDTTKPVVKKVSLRPTGKVM